MASSTFLQFHSLTSSSSSCNPQLFSFIKLPNNYPITLSSKRSSTYKRVYTKAVSTDSQKPLIDNNQNTPSSSSSKLVLVLGGSGGVGQLVVASLLQRNIKSRLILRDLEKAKALFGEQDEEKLQVFKGDTRKHDDLDPSMFEGVTHVICCTGTTAFPSRRWDDENTPERVGKNHILYIYIAAFSFISKLKCKVS